MFNVGAQEWFDASAPAVELSLSLLPTMDEPAYGLILAAELASGGHTRFWAAGKSAKTDKACVDVLRANREIIFGYLSDKNPLRRSAATVALSVAINPDESEEIARILNALNCEQDPLVRASLLLCLSCLEDESNFSDRIQSLKNEEDGYLSGTAALCSMRTNLNWNHGDVSKGIEALLNISPTDVWSEEGRWAWFEGIEGCFKDALDSADPATIALFATVEFKSAETKSRLIDLLFKVGDGSEKILVRDRCCGLLAFIGEMERHNRPFLLTAFTEVQLAMVQRFASSRLCSNARYGMPAAGVIRRRWAGLDEPAPLDRLVESVITKQMVPLWYAWIEYRNKVGFGDPPYLDSFTPLDRWQAKVEFSSGAYQYSTSCTEEERETILRTVSSDNSLLDRVKQLVEEQVWRMENDNWVGNGTFSSTFVYLTLLPWIRAGQPVSDAWARLIVFEDSIHCREILQALNPKQREQIALLQLTDIKNAALDVIGRLASLLPLLNTKKFISRLLECVSEHKKELNGWNEGKAMIATVKELAAATGIDVASTKKKEGTKIAKNNIKKATKIK